MVILNSIFSFAFFVVMLLMIIEPYAAHFFVPFFYRIGIKVKVIQYSTEIKLEKFKIGKEYNINSIKFMRVDKNSCIFFHRLSFFQRRTPFPFKGEFISDKSGNRVIFRLPLWSFMLVSLLFLVWIIPFLLSAFRLHANNPPSALATIFGACILWSVYALLVSVEVKYADLAFLELSNFLSGAEI